MVWLNRPGLVLPPDINLNLLNCSFYILLIFKFLKQVTHIAFEFNLSFQKLQEYQLSGSSFLGWLNLLWILSSFWINFFLLDDEYTGVIGFWKALRVL